MGILDSIMQAFENPETRSMIGGLGRGLLAASAPSPVPRSFGQILGAGFNGADQAQQNYQKSQFIHERILRAKQAREQQKAQAQARQQLIDRMAPNRGQGLLSGGGFGADAMGGGFGMSAISPTANNPGLAPDSQQAQQLGLLAQAYPDQFGKLAFSQLMPQQVKPVQIDTGSSIEFVNPRSGHVVSSFDKGMAPSDKNAVNVITPHGNFLSYDGGRTINVNGQQVTPPAGSYIGSVQGGTEDVGLKLGTAPSNKLQADIVHNRVKLANLDALANDYQSSYLTYGGAAEAALGHVLSKSGMDLPGWLKDATAGRRKFTQGVEQVFNQYRHDITGAQAALQEMKNLRGSMLNKNLSPAEFEASFHQYRELLTRINKIEMQALQEGLKPGTKAFGQRVDEIFTSGTPQSGTQQAQLPMIQPPTNNSGFASSYAFTGPQGKSITTSVDALRKAAKARGVPLAQFIHTLEAQPVK